MNKFFAVVFALIAAAAFYGAIFHNAPWHIATTIACLFFSILFAADSQTPDSTGAQ